MLATGNPYPSAVYPVVDYLTEPRVIATSSGLTRPWEETYQAADSPAGYAGDLIIATIMILRNNDDSLLPVGDDWQRLFAFDSDLPTQVVYKIAPSRYPQQLVLQPYDDEIGIVHFTRISGVDFNNPIADLRLGYEYPDSSSRDGQAKYYSIGYEAFTAMPSYQALRNHMIVRFDGEVYDILPSDRTTNGSGVTDIIDSFAISNYYGSTTWNLGAVLGTHLIKGAPSGFLGGATRILANSKTTPQSSSPFSLTLQPQNAYLVRGDQPNTPIIIDSNRYAPIVTRAVHTCYMPYNVQSGNYLLAVMNTSYATSVITGVNDDSAGGGTWEFLADVVQESGGSSDQCRISIWGKVANGTEVSGVRISASGAAPSYAQIDIFEVSGIDVSNPLVASGAQSGRYNSIVSYYDEFEMPYNSGLILYFDSGARNSNINTFDDTWGPLSVNKNLQVLVQQRSPTAYGPGVTIAALPWKDAGTVPAISWSGSAFAGDGHGFALGFKPSWVPLIVPEILTEPAIIGATSGEVTNDSSITGVSPTGGQAGNILLAALITDGDEGSYMVPDQSEWNRLYAYKMSSSASQALYWKVASGITGETISFSTGGTTESMMVHMYRVSGVDANNPFFNDYRWTPETTSASGRYDRHFGTNGSYYMHRTVAAVTQRNTLALHINSFDNGNLMPASPTVKSNGWTTPYWTMFDGLNGGGYALSYKLYNGGTNEHNWIPMDEIFDTVYSSLAPTNLSTTVLMRPSGNVTRAVVANTDYPEIINLEPRIIDATPVLEWNYSDLPVMSGAQEGEMLYIIGMIDGRQPRSYFRDDKDGFFSKDIFESNNDGGYPTVQVFSKRITGRESDDKLYYDGTSCRGQFMFIRMSGVDSLNRLHASGVAAALTNRQELPDLTTTLDNCRILYLGAQDGARNASYNHTFRHGITHDFAHDSVSGIYNSRSSSSSTHANGMIGTFVQVASGAIGSGTWILENIGEETTAVTLAIPPASGAIETTPSIIHIGPQGTQSPNSSLVQPMPSGSFSNNDIILLLVGAETATVPDIAQENYEWVTVPGLPSSLKAFFRRCRDGETGATLSFAGSDTWVGQAFVIRNAEGITAWSNNSAAIQPSVTTSGVTTNYNKCLIIDAAKVDTGEFTLTAASGTEISNFQSGPNGFDCAMVITTREQENSGVVDGMQFNADGTPNWESITLAIKPRV